MQKDRKSKLAQAFMARRKKQLACYLASTLTVVASASLILPSSLAFDAPPGIGQATRPSGQTQTGIAVKTPANVEADQISSSDALKRVGIRFVGPEHANKQNGTLAESRNPSQQLRQTPTVIQPPMVISRASTEPNGNGSSESAVEGIRIRIPSETSGKSNPTSVPPLKTATLSANSSPNLRLTVGTGVATQSITVASTSSATPKPTFAELPSINAPALPQLPLLAPTAEPQVTKQATQEFSPTPKFSPPPKVSATPASTAAMSFDSDPLPLVSPGKLQEKLQTNTTTTSRAPGIVRIPRIVVNGTSPSLPAHSASSTPTTSVSAPAFLTSDSSFQNLSSTATRPATIPPRRPAMNSESLASSTNRPTELPETQVSSPLSSSQSRMEATAGTATRLEASIIPVALTSTAKNDLIPSQDVSVTTDTFEIYDDSRATFGPSAPASLPSTIAVPLKSVQTIRLPGKVHQIEIENDTICRVISTEPNTLTIIGATVGDSKITVWSTNPTTRASDSQDFRISVRETWGQAAKNSVSIDDVNQSIAALFPGSEIVIKPNSDGSISVQGTATSNESAKQILMLVRKMFLVPVQDRIAIANLYSDRK